MAELKDDIDRYLKGQMGPAEMHALEKKALTDPFLAEALEGADSIHAKDFSDDVEELQRRIARTHQVKWAIPMRIAASVVLLIGASFIIYTFLRPEKPVTLAEKTLKEEPAPSKENVSTDSGTLKEKPQEKLLSLNTPASQPEKTKPKDETKAAQESAPTVEPARELADNKTGAAAEAEKSLDASQVREEAEAKKEDGQAKDEDRTDADRRAKSALAEQGPPAGLKQREDVSHAARALASSAGVSSILPQIINGQVTADDGSPIPGANVLVQGTTEGAVSDVNGVYRIVANTPGTGLVVSFIGYKPKEVKIPAGQSQINVQLSADVSALSEVVVSALGSGGADESKEEVPVQLAEPAGGKRAFNRYLEKNIRYPKEAIDQKIEGKVTVEFVVQANGTLSDFTVIRGLGAGCNDEVVRLVKEGPVWKPSTRADSPISSTVRVRVKFKSKEVK